ncbi:L-asparaginase [Blattamonas nauphoetae]|uniref:asparaginase n=1 Tax=Blattamonas nauphoetae TaxID=2049346 RepID=A0ABQ9Y065_9EUKA|nr:L-asparaginase [Blattamonas nauphoetae]
MLSPLLIALTANIHNANTKRLLFLYTGGLMKLNDHGAYDTAPGFLQEQVQNETLFSSENLPSFDFLEFNPLLDSSDMRLSNWIEIANAIRDNYAKYDEFVVIHGTDTLTYTASALSFLLDGLAKPVVITGSQVPMVEHYNDAVNNLLGSIAVADSGLVCESVVFFKEYVLRGNRAEKFSSVNWGGFSGADMAELGRYQESFTLNTDMLLPCVKSSSVSVPKSLSDSVFIIFCFPGLSVAHIEDILAKAEGVIFMVSSVGVLPTDDDLLNRLKTFTANGKHAYIVSQCYNGHALNVYEEKYGIVSLGTMTVEAAYAKLLWVLASERSYPSQIEKMKQNLKGEYNTTLTTPPKSTQNFVVTTMIVVTATSVVVGGAMLVMAFLIILRGNPKRKASNRARLSGGQEEDSKAIVDAEEPPVIQMEPIEGQMELEEMNKRERKDDDVTSLSS